MFQNIKEGFMGGYRRQKAIDDSRRFIKNRELPEHIVESGKPIVRIADLVDRNWMIRGRDLSDMVLVGPAVLFPLACEFTGNVFNATADALIWEVDPVERPMVMGQTVCENVMFRRCEFVGVGFALNPDMATAFRNMLAVGNEFNTGGSVEDWTEDADQFFGKGGSA